MTGIYQDGQVEADESIRVDREIPVVVTFLEDENADIEPLDEVIEEKKEGWDYVPSSGHVYVADKHSEYNAGVNIINSIITRRKRMLAVKGVYKDGKVDFKGDVPVYTQTPVIITFLEEIAQGKPTTSNLNAFSFKKSRALSKRYKGSLSDAVIEERRSYL